MNQDFDLKIFDLDGFKYWIKHNRVLNEEDFEFIRQDDKKLVSIRLSAREYEDSKLEQVNIYLKFQKCLMIDMTCKNHIEEVKKEYC